MAVVCISAKLAKVVRASHVVPWTQPVVVTWREGTADIEGTWDLVGIAGTRKTMWLSRGSGSLPV